MFIKLHFVLLFVVSSLQDPTHLQSVLNPLSAVKLWDFYGVSVPTKTDVKVTPDIPDRIGFIQTKNKIKASSKWEIKTSVVIGKEPGRRANLGEGLAFWVLLEGVDYANRKYVYANAPMFGSDGKYKGLGIFFVPKQNAIFGKESMGVVGYNPDTLKDDNTLKCTRNFSPNENFFIKIAFSDGIILVYYKNDMNDKYVLCFTSSGIGKGLREFYFAVSASTKQEVCAYHSIKDLMIFSDEILDGDFSTYLNGNAQHEVHARDILRAGHIQNASEYSSSVHISYESLSKAFTKNAAYLLSYRNKLKGTLKENEIILRWIHSVKNNMPTEKETQPVEAQMVSFKAGFDKMKATMMQNQERFKKFREMLEEKPLTGKVEGLLKKLEDFSKRIEILEPMIQKQGYNHIETRARMKNVVDAQKIPQIAMDEHVKEAEKLLKEKTGIIKSAAKNRSLYIYIIIFIGLILGLILYSWRRLAVAEKKHLF